MPAKRRVRHGARPIQDVTPGIKGHVKRFFTSFQPRNFRRYWLSWAGLLRITKICGLGVLAVVLVFLYYSKDLPSPSKINAKLGLTTTFYARDAIQPNGSVNYSKGTVLYEVHGDENRLIIDFNQMPNTIKDATVAVEDKNFYHEGAFSVTGLARASLGVVTHNTADGGGSTITQQYVKNALLTDQRSYSRKIKELILSIEINQFYSKDDILKLYLNEIPYGNGAYGIEAACRTYFSDQYGKTNCAQHLDLSQSALLAAIPNLPSYYNPYGEHIDDLIARQHLILDDMATQGYVTQAQANAAKWTAANLDTTQANPSINKNPTFNSAVTAPNFVYTLQDQLEAKYGTAAVEEGGWKVITTLNPDLQHCAELSIYNPDNQTCTPDGKTSVNPNSNNKNYSNLLYSKGSNAALVAADPNTGQVLAMVGSYSFEASQINMATTPRQPGSSFKPYVYAALVSKNINSNCTSNSASSPVNPNVALTCDEYGAGTTFLDTTTEADSLDSSGQYHPRDFGGSAEVGGPVTMRTALDASLNIPAVQALKIVGVQTAIDQAKSQGITTLNDPASTYGLSLVLGSGEVSLADHVNGYESFANGGLHYDPTMVLKIYDSKNNIIEDNTKPATPKRVLDAQSAYIINNILSDNDAGKFVFGSDLAVPGHIGHGTAGQGVAVKTGTTQYYNDAWTMGYTPTLVAGVWAGNDDNSSMTNQAADIAAPIWKGFMTAALADKGLETFPKPPASDKLQFLPSTGGLKSLTSYDFYPSWYKAPHSSTIKVDRVSGLLATSCTPPLAVEEIPDNGTTATDNVHDCSDTQPQVSLSGISGGGPYAFNAAVTLGTFGTSKTGNGPTTLQIYFDDQLIYTKQGIDSETYQIPSYTPTSNGSHVIKAVVTDSGYYQGTDSDTVNVTNASSASNGSLSNQSPEDGSNQSTGSINFVWSAQSGASNYTLYVDQTARATTPSTSYTLPVTTRGTHTWYVVASDGTSSSPTTFTTN